MMGPKPRPLLERWLDKVLIGDGCWLWQGSTSGNGYGKLKAEEPGSEEGAHRVAYRLFVGPIQSGEHVLHHCDTPACVRPSHLFLGDQAANVADMRSKGRARHARGVDNGALLTEEDVQAIRRLTCEGASQRKIAARFSVSRGCVRNIIEGKTWAWLPWLQATREYPEVPR